MKIDQVDGSEYWTVEHPDDLLAWSVLREEPFKEGVARLHVVNVALPFEFRLLYCENGILRERDQLRFGVLVSEVVYEDILDADIID